ncbi:GWxTD domain-containing protein [Fulvivirgaceae bacterium BMA10]|uniref:GWxTD domain-containing protein n=1 Tax=Splendidivirga corallicola TaxID=3051826 RepID=A0ABT8KJ25_9BACT|nr:GWxTD domain-containing protein [Fulvivirgaceae bacterium BMA10]
MTVSILDAQDLTKVNLSYKYDSKSEVHLQYAYAADDDKAVLFLKIGLERGENELEDDYELSYKTRNNYHGKVSSSQIITKDQFLKREDNHFHYQLDIPWTGEGLLVEIYMQNIKTKRQFFFDIPIKNEQSFSKTDLLFFEGDLPLFTSYATTQQNLTLKPLLSTTDKVYCFKYAFDFTPADLPMSERRTASKKNMEIDSVFTINTNQPFNLNDEGLYFFQKDTTKLEGMAIRITNEYYPKLARIDDLINPLIYISTGLEFKSLQNVTDKKEALDSYWWKMTKSRDRAKTIIRNYYNHVEKANRLFTHYKEGWKTDQGMIFMIFGQPDEVYRTDNAETWIFNKKENFPKLKFTFAKVKNLFTANHYELVRSRSFERYWYQTVDLWRKGRKGI